MSKTERARWRKCSGEGEIRNEDREEILKVEKERNRGRMDNSAGEEEIHRGEGDTISSTDMAGDSHCRGTGSRFQYKPERNREHCIITEQETQLLLSTVPEREEQKKNKE